MRHHADSSSQWWNLPGRFRAGSLSARCGRGRAPHIVSTLFKNRCAPVRKRSLARLFLNSVHCFQALSGMIIGVYKILFHFEAWVDESILFYCPPPSPALPTLLHHFCTTIAQHPPSPTPMLYAIYHTILVMAISRKGQDDQGSDLCSSSDFGLTWVNP